jgi:hypothetical protein
MSIETIRALKEAAKFPKIKKVYKIAPKSAKKIAQEKDAIVNADNRMDKWFEARRKEMTGRCFICNGKTEKYNDETYRRSIHHLLDKRPSMFPSIATNENNWIEVCHFGNSCHDNIHNKTITWDILRDSKEWELIVRKFKRLYPCIAEKEKRNIPELLLKSL